jgi:NCAIR mutase (PurE)-related protein
MNSETLRELLKRVQSGEIKVDEAMLRLKKLPFEDLGYAKIDCHRGVRTGVPEVIFCLGKSLPQIQGIVERISQDHHNVMATHADPDVFKGIQEVHQDCEYHETARIAVINPRPVEGVGNIAVVSAGTADIPVAEEAAVTADVLGNHVNRIYDVGVAGLHRLLDACDDLFQANVAVVVAGMEGALASVVGGLVSCPVIAVPTSVGYGTNFGGVAALLSMLNTCASGVSVVNIDNGFGAAYQASLINQIAVKGVPQESVSPQDQTPKKIRLAKLSS